MVCVLSYAMPSSLANILFSLAFMAARVSLRAPLLAPILDSLRLPLPWMMTGT